MNLIDLMERITELYDNFVKILTKNGITYTGKIVGVADDFLVFDQGDAYFKKRICYKSIMCLSRYEQKED